MSSINVSDSGTVFCGSRFADLRRAAPPASVSYLKSNSTTGKWDECDPTVVSFSPSQTNTEKRSTRSSICAVAYDAVSGPFFAVGVFRSDTWAIQWVIQRADCLVGAEIRHLIGLSPSLVCGTYCSKNGKAGFFVASRRDVARVAKKENRVWRSFESAPKSLSLSFSADRVVLMKPLSASSALILLKDGTMVSVAIHSDGTDEGACRATESPVGKAGSFKEFTSKTPPEVIIQSSSGTPKSTCFLVYTAGSPLLEVVQLNSEDATSDKENAIARTRVALPKGSSIRHASFAGPFHIAVVLSDNSILFVSLIPEGTGSFSTSNSTPFTAPAPVIATWFDASSENHVVLCGPAENTAIKQSFNELFFWTCPFTNGPYTLSELEAAEVSYVSSFTHLRGTSEMSAETEMKYFLNSAFRSERIDNSAPLKLHYALAATDSTGNGLEQAVFSVETAPYVHTRITQQWHNAATGLRALLGDETCSSCIRLPWNPRHLRRALRLMSPEQLTATFRRATGVLAEQGQGQSTVLFSECATAAMSVALQIVTLSRQVGCVIDTSDIETIAVLLRAARTSGHTTIKYANRMELLLETSLQQRLVNRLLQGTQKESTNDFHSDFFGVATALRSERQLQTRYNAHTWADELGKKQVVHNAVAEAAAKYLAVAGSDGVAVSDWKELGTRRGADTLLNEFESTLVTFTD